MKIVDLEIQNMRGIRRLELHPAGKNLVILGPNGAGKSAVVDAVDFLLTGEIARLHGPGTSGITEKQHGRHIAASPKDAWVKATVRLGGREFVISRCLAKDKELKCPEEHRARLDRVVQLARLGHHRLTRREILRFVTAESGKRAESIQELLNIQEIDKIRRAINTTASSAATRLSAKELDVQRAEDTLCAALDIAPWYLASAVEKINRWRANLGGSPLGCEDLAEIKKDLRPPGGAVQSRRFNPESAKEQLWRAGQLLSGGALLERERIYNRLLEISCLVKKKPHLLRDFKVVELLRLGQKLLDGAGQCPLCLAEHAPGALAGLVASRLQCAEEAAGLYTEMRQGLEALERTSTGLQVALREALEAAEQTGLEHESEWLRGLLRQTEAALRQTAQDRDSYRLGGERSAYITLDMPGDFIERLNKLSERLADLAPCLSPEQDAWDRLTRLEVLLENWTRQRGERSKLSRQHALAQKLKANFEKARVDVLEGLYREISARFTELYKMLHAEDEGFFSARLAPCGGGVDFLVDFHGFGENPPHALHSEGHQDSMGVCLFLALAERLTQGALDLIVLDDVVMSVDSGHRRQLGEMLARKFPQRQFLITTHDRVWATQLRNAGVVRPAEIIKFHGWDLDRGPLLSDMSDLWKGIEADLARGDVNAAAARLRWELEEFASHASDALQARVRFALDGRLELGELMPAAIGQYKKFLQDAQKAADSWGQGAIKQLLSDCEDKLKETFAQKEVDQWMINSSVHYNVWADLTPEEFRRVAQAHKALIDLFYCPVCGSLVFLVEEGRQPANLRCQCGNINWNLVEKGKR